MSSLLLGVLRDDVLIALTPELERTSQAYLNELLTNDDLLSTDAYTASAPDATAPTAARNIVEEIAELDLAQHQLDRELAALTNRHRGVIVDVARTLRHIHTTELAQFGAEAAEMAQGAHHPVPPAAVAARLDRAVAANAQILRHIDSVLDVLELPLLCKLCIHQGNYQELLEILVQVQSLCIRFPQVALFRHVRRQVDAELQLMVRGLVRLVHTDLKHNTILKLFQILGKLATPRPHHLRALLLNARFKFIVLQLDTLRPLIAFNRAAYLKRYIEVYREHIFSALSLYHTIFDAAADAAADAANALSDALTAQFIRSLVALLADSMATHYPHLPDPAAADGLLLQIIYLCRSLAKYNVDFESAILWQLCYQRHVIAPEDWQRNLTKVRKA
jgi:hypothetical protein